MRRSATVVMALGLLAGGVLAACGDDDDSAIQRSTEESTDATSDPGPGASADDGPVRTGAGTATVTLDVGETYEFSVLCVLEPQEAAGTVVSFTVVSYDEPVNLDVTQFDDEDLGATIGLYDSETFDPLWEASSVFGGEASLTQDGATITGSGVFYREGDPSLESSTGELVANC